MLLELNLSIEIRLSLLLNMPNSKLNWNLISAKLLSKQLNFVDSYMPCLMFYRYMQLYQGLLERLSQCNKFEYWC